MPITIVEGPDFAGKTTYCFQQIRKLNSDYNAAYVHFPIRRREDVLTALSNSKLEQDCSPEQFYTCKSFAGKNISEIQDIIFENLVLNAYPILQLHDKGYHVYIDRYIHSNVVYRQLHSLLGDSIDHILFSLGDSVDIKAIESEITNMTELLKLADIVMLIPDEQTLLERKANQRTDKPADNLDQINEEEKNIIKARELYLKYESLLPSMRVAH